MSDPKLAAEPVIHVLDIDHAGYAPDGDGVVVRMKLKDNNPPTFVMPPAIAEKLIYALQMALTGAVEKRIGKPAAAIRGPILEVSSIAAKAAPDGSHAVLTFEAPSSPPANIRLEARDLVKVRQELKRIEDQLRRLRTKPTRH